jgi:serine/threonine-protein kinase
VQPEPTPPFSPGEQNPPKEETASFQADGQPTERESPLGARRVPDMPRICLREPDREPISPVTLRESTEMGEVRQLAPTARLQLFGELAHGGMGAILKGRDMDLGRDVAVKVLLEAHQAKPEMVERFVAEAQIHGQLQHPGVAPVYELGRLTDHRPYFTMKLVKGQTLSQLLAERKERKPGAPSLARLLSIFGQICQTLAYAHARNVIHRDLKPSNVMVGAYSELQVMDWGLAKVLAECGYANERRTQAPARPEVSIIRTLRKDDSEGGSTGDSHTQAGSVLGTPAYMAPEQARGDVDLVDQRADVFGIGAILCEMLTGQPPYTGNGAEVQRKSQTAKLDAAYARLDACGADAELVGLAKRCLAAEPWDRPADAGEVAHAVTVYEHSVAQRLRQAELECAAAEARGVEEARTRQMAEAKAEEERKRRRVTLALAAALLALVIIGGGGAAWWIIERRTTEHDVYMALEDATKYRDAGRWPEARAALERAEGRLGTSGLRVLRDRVRQARLDSDLVAELDEIRLAQSERGPKALTDEAADARYAKAFQLYGIEVETGSSAEAMTKLAGSAVRDLLLAGLHDWLRIKPAMARGRLQVLLDCADSDVWRQAFRAAVMTKDIGQLKRLATQKEAFSQLPAVQSWLAKELRSAGVVKEAKALLRQGQQQHPSDFWLNYQLGWILAFGSRSVINLTDRPEEEAVGYFRAAVAIRPGSAIAHNYLGVALGHKGTWDDAAIEFQKAISLDPKYARAYSNLGLALVSMGELTAAIAAYRQAIDLDPQDALAHSNLAELLAMPLDPKLRDPVQAIAEAKQAVMLEPNIGMYWNILGSALYSAGQTKEAVQALEKSLALSNGGDSKDFFLLAMAHVRLGQKELAGKWFQKGVAWMEKNQSKDPDVARYRAVAADLLGGK